MPDLRSELRRHFGFPTFRPGQEEAIGHVLAGRDVLVVMPTGAGKSLCYQLPALLLPGTTLVISPLIALMKDQVDGLAALDKAATYINSTLSASEQGRRLKAMADGAYKLVYIAPERLRSRPFVRALAQVQIALLVVDEAHCISQWGHDFRPDYLHLRQVIQDLGQPPVLASTATATPEVQQDILQQLGLARAERVITGFNRPNLTFAVRYTLDQAAKLRELKALLTETPDNAIIYVGTRREAEEVAEFVNEVVGTRADYYHAGLEAGDRTHIQEAFMGDELPIVVATNAFGMGVDKADIRAVIHYTLPGTVEAYYQEAGRAGRDGRPSQCVLLYSPEDRALQEWFIENDAPDMAELRELHRLIRGVARSGMALISGQEIQRQTGLPEVKVRVGISQLERAGALRHLGDEGGRMALEVLPIKKAKLAESAAEVERRRAHRRRKLAQMIAYAESNACRRRFILDYFGDQGPAEAERCCDNCLMRAALPAEGATAKSAAEWIPLVILETVRTLERPLGREKLAQILKGSRAKAILRFGYDRHRFYGKLAPFTKGELQSLLVQLIGQGYLKVIGGQYPVLALTPLGQSALKARAAIRLQLSGLDRVENEEARKRIEAERKLGTVGYTHQLFQAGLTPQEIAIERGLTLGTIYKHLSQLIGQGLVSVDAVVSPEVQQRIRETIAQVGMDYLAPIKQRLPESISYEEIRCVVEDERRKEREVTPEAPRVADEVEQFLTRARPKPLKGPWRAGYALDFNSRFQGDRWQRTEIGEMTYRFKYGGDRSLGRVLGKRLADFIRDHPEFQRVDGLVPIPPSRRDRAYDPVTDLARVVSQETGLPVLDGVLVKARTTRPQKEMTNLVQKQANVAGAFRVQGDVRRKGLLLLDDLYDSGATLEEATRALLRVGASVVYVLTLTKTIHAD